MTIDVHQRKNELHGAGTLRRLTPLGPDESLIDNYGLENGRLLVSMRNLLGVFTDQIEAFPELDSIEITDDPGFRIFYSPKGDTYKTYISGGAIIRYFNFVSYSLSCTDVLPGFHSDIRDQERVFDMIDELLEKMMEAELTSISGMSDGHAALSMATVLSGMLSMVCHEIIHIVRDHARMRRPFLLAQPDEIRTAISKSGLTEFSNIRLRDYEMASFYRALELDADYHSWPNALERSKIVSDLFRASFKLIMDPYELFVLGLYSVHVCHSFYEASNLDFDTDLGTTFRTHPTTHNRLLFMRRMLSHLLSQGAFSKEETPKLMAALDRIVNGLGGCKPYPIAAYDVMQLKDQEIMLKDFENFRKIASA